MGRHDWKTSCLLTEGTTKRRLVCQRKADWETSCLWMEGTTDIGFLADHGLQIASPLRRQHAQQRRVSQLDSHTAWHRMRSARSAADDQAMSTLFSEMAAARRSRAKRISHKLNGFEKGRQMDERSGKAQQREEREREGRGLNRPAPSSDIGPR